MTNLFSKFLLKKIEVPLWKLISVGIFLLLIPYFIWEVFWYLRVGSNAIKWHTYLVFFLIVGFVSMLPFNWAKFFRQTFLLGLSYFFFSMIIGEKHPFTQVPMYNSFPNQIPIIAMCNLQNEPIPFNKNFSISAGGVIHKYWQITRSVIRGNELYDENKVDEMAGNSIFQELIDGRNKNVNKDSLKLVMFTYSLQNDSIYSTFKILNGK